MSASPACPHCRTPVPEAPPSGLCPVCGAAWDAPPGGSGDPTHTFSPAAVPTPPHPGAATLPYPPRHVAVPRRVPHIPNYRDITYLTSGGMGAVFRAVQCGFERVVAIKLINGAAAYDPAARLRFGNEMQALGRVDHPGVVKVFDHGDADDAPFYSMEYVGGGTLAQLLARRGGALPPDEAVRVMAAVAEAVQAAHREGVLHRDVKPGNILLTEDGTPKVADFGLAKLTDSAMQMTLTGSQLGTPPYMAPEQVRGTPTDITARTDVYGLGATLYECLTGRPPFKGATPQETVQRVLESDLDPPSSVRPGVPEDLEAVCLKCLAKDPAERFATAGEVAAELRRWQAGEPTLTRPQTRWQKGRRWGKRHRVKLAAVTVVLLAVLGVLAAMWRSDPRRQIERDLTAGRRVVLVAETGNPRWSRWEAGAVDLSGSVTEDGTCGFQTHTTSVLTLVLDPKTDSFRLSADLRQIRSGNDNSGVGLFVGAHDVPARPDLRTTALVGFEFTDFWRSAELQMPKLQANHGLDARGLALIRDGVSASVSWVDLGLAAHFRPTNLTPSGWRTIVVDVSPAGVTAFWQTTEGKGFRLTAGEIEAEFASHSRQIASGRPGFQLPKPVWNPRGAVGVYARSSAVSVRNVTLHPVSAPGGP